MRKDSQKDPIQRTNGDKEHRFYVEAGLILIVVLAAYINALRLII